mgnify:CR=1 FL=1
MRTKAYGEELTAETLENVTGVILYLDLKPYLNDWVGTMVVEKKTSLWRLEVTMSTKYGKEKYG